MKITISFNQFEDAFRRAGRAEQFSHDALSALFDYLTMIEQDTDTEIELDVIGLCCDFFEVDKDDNDEVRRLKEEDAIIAETDNSFLAYSI